MTMMTINREDPVVSETAATLREWHKICISLYLDNQIDLFDKISALIVELVDSRSELKQLLKLSFSYSHQLNNTATYQPATLEQQIAELKRDIVNKLDLGNRLLNLDLVIRDSNFKPIDPIELSPVKLYQMHADAASQSPPDNSQIGNHLQLALRNHQLVSLPSDELVEVFFSIVEAVPSTSSIAKPLTERYLVQFQNGEQICGVSNTIFTDIGSPIGRDLCLHVQVYRVGKMTLMDGTRAAFGKQQNSSVQDVSTTYTTNSISSSSSSSSQSRNRNSVLGLSNASSPNYRRPFGATTVPIKGTSFRDIQMSLKVNSTSESEFRRGQNQPSIQLDLVLKFLSCPQESLSKLSSAIPYCITGKRGFPEIVMPGDFKNDLFFTLESAEFEKGGKSIAKNIEASISLINKSGFAIDGCISPGTNCDNVSSYRSCVFYHSNNPRWNESIKINVPLSEFDSAHIRLEFRHCSTKEKEKRFLGFCFLPLSDQDGAVLADKSHELYLYKCDPAMWDDESLNLCKYTSLAYGPMAKPSTNNKMHANIAQHFSHSNREIVTVSTSLVSTKLTQNGNLLNLLKWRELIKKNNKDFENALRKVLVLEGEEIVKFLQDILDTLFDTFSLYSTSGDEICALIFKVLVHIFLLLDEPKYQHFRPVLDNYASAHFSATLVYRGLLACVKKCLECSSIVERHVPIQRCLQSIRYVFQFIVQSKILYSQATGETNDELFMNDFRHLTKLFELLLSKESPKLIPIQVTFLEYFSGAITQLIKIVHPRELAKTVIDLVGSVGFTSLPPPLSRAKMIFMKETANTELIKNQEIRLIITESFCRHIEIYLKNNEETELCYELLEILTVKIHDYNWPLIYRLHQLSFNVGVVSVAEISMTGHIPTNQLDLAIKSLSKELEPLTQLLELLLDFLDHLNGDPNGDRLMVQKYSTGLLTILKLMSRPSFEQLMEERKIDFLKLCNLFRSLRAVYDRDWSIMQLTSHAILENLINEFSKEMKSPSNRQLNSYIKLIVDFITHPTLQMEAFSERKKTNLLCVFGDLRLKFCAQLLQFWTGLKTPNICDIIPISIQSILDASMSPNEELQKRLIPVFWDMINAEMQLKHNTKQFEHCFIDNLDMIINLDKCNAKFTENFQSIMGKLIEERQPTWEQKGLKVINSLTKLMHLLIDYRHSLENSENRSKQMTCLVDLLNFYKEQERTDLHLKYLFKLSDMHLEAKNHSEAAFTLKLYADEIKWCQQSLVPLDGYRPEEQEWHRKEVLYQKIIHHFDIGKCWEEAIPLCKELASFYETFLVDYEKLSGILKTLARFLDCIMTEHRPEREYFRVQFLGKDSAEFVRDKVFIYRGCEYERLADFMQRISFEFPNAQILNSQSKKYVDKDSQGEFIVISNVKPVPLLDHLKSEQRIVNDKVMHYYLNNRVDTFSYDVPIIKMNKNNNNNNSIIGGGGGGSQMNGKAPTKQESSETAASTGADNVNVRNLWVGRHLLKTRKQLPDILPWTEVTSEDYTEVSPINHAIETISIMNVELSRLILSYKNEPTNQISPLTMRLQGVIDAAVNGGVSVYLDAFLKRQPGEQVGGDAYSTTYEPEAVNKVRDLIIQQFSALEMGLNLHAKLAPPNVMPLHERLVERFASLKKTLLVEGSSQHNDENVDLPPHVRRDKIYYWPSITRYSLKSNQKGLE